MRPVTPAAARLRTAASRHLAEASAARARADWRELLDQARAAAGLTGAASHPPLIDTFARMTARCAHAPPPLENASDREAAEGFLALCRAWRGRPAERRAAMAEALIAAARLIDDLMTEDQVRAADAWKRRFPEDD